MPPSRRRGAATVEDIEDPDLPDDESGDDGFSWDTAEPQTIEALPRSARGRKSVVSPRLAQHVADSVDADPQVILVPNGKAAHKAVRQLRRAVDLEGYGLSVRYTDEVGKPLAEKTARARTSPLYVAYQVSSERRAYGD